MKISVFMVVSQNYTSPLLKYTQIIVHMAEFTIFVAIVLHVEISLHIPSTVAMCLILLNESLSQVSETFWSQSCQLFSCLLLCQDLQ